MYNYTLFWPIALPKKAAPSQNRPAPPSYLSLHLPLSPAFLFLCHDKKPRLSQGKFSEFLCFFYFFLLFLRQSPRKYIFTLPRSPALHPRPASEACAFPLSLRSFCKSALLWLPGSSLCPSGPSIRCSTPETLSRTFPSGTGP